MPPVFVSSPRREFRRGYAACAVCRAHKVKCVLGTEPPCAKCRREHRECVFDRAGRGSRTRDVRQWAGRVQLADATATRNGEQRHSQPRVTDHPSITSESNRDDASEPKGVDLTNAQRKSSSNPPRLQLPAQPPTSLLERTICTNETPGFFSEPPISQGDGSAGLVTASPRPIQPNQQKRNEVCELWQPPVVPELSQIDDEGLEVYSKIPYVRVGWLTARETLTYLDIGFHRHLAPFCPAFMSEAEVGRSWHTRIAQEPMLCTTILMITSRFFTLPGPGGLARCHLLHHRLWQQCERLIQLLMYGQEKHLRGNRTWGTIQSLLLLSEWHPRSLQSLFCSSQNDMWEGREPRVPHEGSSESQEESYPARYEQDLLDRAKQSDRVSWMMVGAALNLAHEAGVFVDACLPNGTEGSEWLDPQRTRKVLYVYVTNLSVRLGFHNTFIQDIILARAILPAEGFGRPGAESSDLSMELWLSLVRLSRTASAMFFRSPSSTKDQLCNGDYIILLQSFAVTLSNWYDDFVASQSVMDQDIQRLLLIEYHNLKTYTHALALQAVLERTRSQNFTTCLRKDRLELLSTCYLPEDFAFIHEVITNSNTILQITMEMAVDGRLRFIPIRQLQCVMSAFVFLFKAITICTSREDVQTSLVVLERCVRALGEADMDEMDISGDTQAFLHSHVRRIRDKVDVFFSTSTDTDQALAAQVLADLSEPPAVDAMTASQPWLLGVNWNEDIFAMVVLPTDLATPWSSLETSGRLTAVDLPWQSVDIPWDAPG